MYFYAEKKYFHALEEKLPGLEIKLPGLEIKLQYIQRLLLSGENCDNPLDKYGRTVRAS